MDIQDSEAIKNICQEFYQYANDLKVLSSENRTREMFENTHVTMIKMINILDVLIKYNYLSESTELINWVESKQQVESKQNSKSPLFTTLYHQIQRHLYKIERISNIFPNSALHFLYFCNSKYATAIMQPNPPDVYDTEYIILVARSIFGAENPKYFAVIIQFFGRLEYDEYISEWIKDIFSSLLSSTNTEFSFINTFINTINVLIQVSSTKTHEVLDPGIILKLESFLMILNERLDNECVLKLKAKLLFSIGTLYMYYIENREINAIPFFEQCLELRKEIYGYNSNEYARSLTMIAQNLCDEQRQYELLQEAYEIRKSIFGENAPSSLNAAEYLASALKKLGRNNEAIHLLEHTLSFDKLPEYEHYLSMYKKLAYLYSDTYSEKAAECWNYIRENCEHENNDLYIESSINYANELRQNGDYPKALHILQSLKDLIACNDKLKDEYYATCINDIGLCMRGIFGEKNPKAIHYLMEASEIRLAKYSKDSGMYWRAFITKNLLNHDNPVEQLSAFEEAERYYNESLALKNSIDYTYLQLNLISLYFELNKSELAKQKLANFYFQPGIQSPKIKAEYDYYIALSFCHDNNIEEAIRYCHVAFHESDIFSNQRIKAGKLLADLYLRKQDAANCSQIIYMLYKESKDAINRLLYLRDHGENIEQYINKLRDVSSSLLILSDFDISIDTETIYEAVLYNKYLLFGFDRLLMNDYVKRVNHQILMLQKEQEELIRQCLELEIIKPSGHKTELEEKKQKINSINETLQDPSQLLDKISKKWDVSYLADSTLLLECYSIELTNKFIGISIMDTDTLSAHDVQHMDVEKLHNIPSRELYMFFVVKKGQPIFNYTVPKTEIDSKVKALRSAIDNKAPLLSESQQIYDLLFSKIEDYLTDIRHILIAPDGVLFQVPFEILQNECADYLVDRFAISYINAGNQLYDMQHKPVEIRKPLLMGNPDFSSKNCNNGDIASKASFGIFRDKFRNDEIKPLPFTELEVRSISNLLHVPCYCFEQASKRNFIDNANASIIHIATHGFDFNEISEQSIKLNAATDELQPHRRSLFLTGLFLCGAENAFQNGTLSTDNGILTANEITQLDLSNTDLVVLSACETGKGYYLRDEGVWGLRRSFELAGAHSILISLWNVNDLSTYILMLKFYEHLTDGYSRTESLKLSQIFVRNMTAEELYNSWLTDDAKLLLNQNWQRTNESYVSNINSKSSENIFAHPKYWAGFVLFGTWD
jgi:CHAT domain-containing protein